MCTQKYFCSLKYATLLINPFPNKPWFLCVSCKSLLKKFLLFPQVFSTLYEIFLSLNIFILHWLRNKFLQLILISLDSASWELHQYSHRMCGPMKNPKVETRSQDSNSGPHDCKADALPHDHRHHTEIFLLFSSNLKLLSANSFSMEESKVCCLGKA